MKAITCRRYGPPSEVLRLEDVDVPAPAEGEVLIRVHAASVNPVEWHLVRGEPLLIHLLAGLRAPKDPLLGGDGAGVVEALGPGVTELAVGDEVFGTTMGSLAELACGKVGRLARKPAQLTFEQAASLPVAGCTALQALRDHASLEAGQRVLVLGASGGVGTFAVQIAKSLGADVTGVCSTPNVELVRSLGADHVVDYLQAEPTGEYDVVLQVAGNRSLSELRALLGPRGTLVLVGGGVGRDGEGGILARIAKARLVSRKNGRRIVTFIAKINTADLATLAELVASGRVRPVIEQTYPLADAASALTAIEGGHVRGKLVVAIPR